MSSQYILGGNAGVEAAQLAIAKAQLIRQMAKVAADVRVSQAV